MTRKALYPNPAHEVTKAVEFVERQIGMPPTIAELKDILNVGSTRTVLRYLRQAEAEGLIKRWPGARGIKVL